MSEANDDDAPGRHIWIGPYVVACLDVLNQKDKLRTLNWIPQTAEEREKYVAGLKETVGVVALFRGAFDAVYESVEETTASDLARLDREQSELLRSLLRTDIMRRHFSDLMVHYARLDREGPFIPIRNVQVVLLATAIVFLTTLAKDLICRGGIEVGIGGEFFDSELYGPALYHAYRLESEVAQYPRVVVGPALCEHIRLEKSQEEAGPRGRFRRTCADLAQGLVCRDVDGAMILDYLGRQVREFPGTDSSEVAEIEALAKAEWERFKKEGNHKLASRYFCLVSYIVRRRREYWS